MVNASEKIEINLPSSLYPFKLSDLPKFEYDTFTLQNVFQSITDTQRQACAELWLRNGVIPSAEAAMQRSQQVCYYITESASGKLIGVNTLYVDKLVSDGPDYYFNRMFIDPHYRNTRLMIMGTAMMLCYARTHLAKHGIPGIINVNENTKLSRTGAHKMFRRLGYRRLGEQNGLEVIFFEFDRVHFNEV